MKHLTYISIFFLAIILQDIQAQNSSQFNWMIGVWQLETKAGVIHEQWKIVNDTLLTGTSHLVQSNGVDSLLETIDIIYTGGNWIYQPTVQGQNNEMPVSFKIIFLKEEEFIAENSAHDFPQRITYRRIQTGLYASIEGWKNEAFSKINFDFYLP